MFILDNPYVSDFLRETIDNNSLPSIDLTKTQESYKLGDSKIYTNSENSIGWLSNNLISSDLIEKIELFKNKVKFRDLLSTQYPNFFYKEVKFDELDKLNINSIPAPFIIKPAVGFFSMGVYLVENSNSWNSVKESIDQEVKDIKNIYPGEVLDYNSFIIEECIAGDEYAIDAYYDENGEPVILNILEHTFSSEADVSDRVYKSSKKIILENLNIFTEFLRKVGELSGVRNFPCHIEVRKSSNGSIVPIEVNPLRFGGWCTTADFTYYSYGFNPYLYFYNGEKPNWDKILMNKDYKNYALIVLDNSTGYNSNSIESFNYSKLLSNFKNPLKLRKIDHNEYPVFGFLFVESLEEDSHEINHILRSDLKEYANLF